MRRLLSYLTVTLVLLFNTLPAHAVLKGYNLNETVIMLKSELELFSTQIKTLQSDFMLAREEYVAEMQDFRKEMVSVMLSLYSQQERYIFGNAYASEVAQKLCDKFYKRELPIELWRTTYEHAYDRCLQLQKTLEEINPDLLDAVAKQGRIEALASLDGTLANLDMWHGEIRTDIEKYRALEAEVQVLQENINNNYRYLLKALLLTPDKQPTHKVYGEKFVVNWKGFLSTMAGILGASNFYGWEFQDKWNEEGGYLLLLGLLAFLVGFLLALFVIIKRQPKRWDIIHTYPKIFSLFCGWLAVTVTYFIIDIAFTTNPFFDSALDLIMELCLMYIALNLSVLLRVRKGQFIPTLLSYTPSIVLLLFLVLYRMLLVDISVVRITYPVLLFACILGQIFVNIRLRRKLLPLDRYVSTVALVLLLGCFAMTFRGYYYVSVYIALSWAIFVMGLLGLSCFYNYINRIERKHKEIDETAYLQSWRQVTFTWLFKPMAFIIVFFTCLFECVHVFSIDEWFTDMMNYKFLNYPDIICLSLRRICFIIISAILTNYLVRFVNYVLRVIYHEKADVGAVNLCRHIFAIIVWGLFVILTLTYMEVNYLGIMAAFGGLAVGLGIALRDTFDCLLCGIILMMGRIKIGDYVEIGNSYRGKVLDIQYRATLIETDDGAVIQVFNTQFFDKDFKNLSFSGDYQRLQISFRVQKEVNTKEMRQLLAQALAERVPELAKSPAPQILFGSSDDYHINMIALVWVSIYDYDEGISNVKETLFNTLFEHGMNDMSVESRVIFTKAIAEVEEANIYHPKI